LDFINFLSKIITIQNWKWRKLNGEFLLRQILQKEKILKIKINLNEILTSNESALAILIYRIVANLHKISKEN